MNLDGPGEGRETRGAIHVGLLSEPRRTILAMKRTARLLRQKAVNSLLLAVEHFNRPWDCGRTEAVVIFLDHSFEMLLKASIVHRGGRIREKGAKQTLGFDACVRKGLSDGGIRFLEEDQALTLQTINGLRDAAQHYLLEVPEELLYLYAQAGVTLFADLLESVFGEKLADHMPERVLPISTRPPTDLTVMVSDEVETIRKLLRPGSRRLVQARARVRALAIAEATTRGERLQPSDGDLNRILLRRIRGGEKWDGVFPGVASLTLAPDGNGIPFSIRITKKEGVPVHIVPEGTPGASVVAIKRVDELGYYSLGRDQVAAQCGLNGPRTTAVIRALGIQNEPECFKEFRIGKATFRRYSQKAVERVKQELPSLDLEDVWAKYGAARGRNSG